MSTLYCLYLRTIFIEYEARMYVMADRRPTEEEAAKILKHIAPKVWDISEQRQIYITPLDPPTLDDALDSAERNLQVMDFWK